MRVYGVARGPKEKQVKKVILNGEKLQNPFAEAVRVIAQSFGDRDNVFLFEESDGRYTFEFVILTKDHAIKFAKLKSVERVVYGKFFDYEFEQHNEDEISFELSDGKKLHVMRTAVRNKRKFVITQIS